MARSAFADKRAREEAAAWFARLVAPEVAMAMGPGRVVNDVDGDPDSPKIPGSTVNVSVPAEVPVEKTMLGCALRVMTADPALTADAVIDALALRPERPPPLHHISSAMRASSDMRL